MSSRHLMVGVYMCEVHRESGLLQTIFSFFLSISVIFLEPVFAVIVPLLSII